jgi:hypothetical protein
MTVLVSLTLTLASCGSSGAIPTKPDLRETFRLPGQLETCFDEKLKVPEGQLGRVGNMKLHKEAAAMDGRKSACGRNMITRYNAVVDFAVSNEGKTAQ